MGRKYLHTTIVAAITTVGFGLSGCGGTSTTTTMAQHMRQDNSKAVPYIGKYQRAVVQNDFDVAAIDWEYDNLEGLKIHVASDALYLQFVHNSAAPNIQFFLDIDDNAQSGNRDEGGADYMVENGYLYASTSINDWGWKEIGPVKSVIDDGRSDTIMIDTGKLKNRSVVFKVNAQALNASWHPEVSSPQDGTKSIYSQKNSIDWSKVDLYSNNAEKKVKLFDTEDNLYVNIEMLSFPEHTQVYIDSDNSAQTGYSSSSWSSFGRDFLIEDSYLYHYTGQGDWGWEFVDTITRVRTAKDKATLTLTIPKYKLGTLAKKIKVGVETNTKDWMQTTHIPSDVISEYTLKVKNPPVQGGIEISEVMAANAHTILDPDYYAFSDWIELHNKGNVAVDIGGYKLSDTLNDPKWTIPTNTIISADGYLLVWADKKDKKKIALHTNFKLKAKGEAVALFDAFGKSIDAFEYKKQVADISISKQGYMNPTPNASNDAYHDSAILAQAPSFSLAEGFYNNTQLALSGAENIYYTTDGSIPTVHSQRYVAEIGIDKTMSVRAINIEAGKFPSVVATKTYIIGEEAMHLPVIAISTDDKYLDDETIGIYTFGSNGKKMKDCGDEVEGLKANFVQKWERPAHMTFFEEDGNAVLSQDIGLKISGQCSRQYAQKSLQLKADSKYGDKMFDYQVFPDKDIKKFERLKLRNGGQDFIKSHMRDALAQMITKDKMHLNYEAYRPAVVFLNGKYYGVYGLREKMGKEYLKENYGVKKVDLLEDDTLVEEGSSEDYDALNEYLRDHSLVSNDTYNHVASQIDIDNYIDYMIVNIYVGNTDWPGTNLVFWKEAKEGKKWQWLLHDMDFGFGLYSQWGVKHNTLALATAVEGADVDWPNPEWSTLLFRKLLENQSFKNQFKTRFTEQLHTTFAPTRVKGIVDGIAAKVAPQMQRHINRWQVNGIYSYAVNNKEDWQNEVNTLKSFAEQRPDIVQSQLDAL